MKTGYSPRAPHGGHGNDLSQQMGVEQMVLELMQLEI